MSEEKKKRGRPPLSEEEREAKRIAHNRNSSERHKKTGYSAQKKYQQTHKEQYQEYQKKQRGSIYEPKLRIPIDRKEDLTNLLEREGVSLTQMFAALVQDKYGVNLLDDDNL